MKLEDLKICIESELEDIYVLNQSLTPKLGALEDIQHLKRLINMSECSKGLRIKGKIAAFIICFKEDSGYESKNYLYFKKKYKEFLYVDRIGVSKGLENNGLGSILYKHIIENFGDNLNYDMTDDIELPAKMRKLYEKSDKIGIFNSKNLPDP